MQVPEKVTVGEPAELKKPRKRAGEPELTPAEWKEIKAERQEKYMILEVTSKINLMLEDIKQIMEDAEAEEKPVKIIIYSNFDAAFGRVRNFLERASIAYSCAPANDSRQSQKRCSVVMRTLHIACELTGVMPAQPSPQNCMNQH